jgi:hypothetical protein
MSTAEQLAVDSRSADSILNIHKYGYSNTDGIPN